MDGHTRHRLIGVALLLVLAAIVTPVIFRSPEQVRVALDMDIPDPPSIMPVPLSPVVTDEEIEDAEDQIVQAREDTVEAAAVRIEQPPTTDSAALNLAETPSGCTLQVVALSSVEAANALSKKLRDAQYSAYVRRIDGGDQALFRVFVGPELERNRCDDMKQRLAKDIRFKLDGLVVPYSL